VEVDRVVEWDYQVAVQINLMLLMLVNTKE
jgi:hypothetical protein